MLLQLPILKTRFMKKGYRRRVTGLMLDMWTAIYWCEARRNTQSSYSDRRAAIPVGNHELAALMLRSLKLIGKIERCCVRLANKVSNGMSVISKNAIRGGS
jgi:hypothetical protein